MQGNVKEVFERWATAINTVEESIKKANYGYAYTEHLGYITTCPSNCGTGLRASVMLKLPKVMLSPSIDFYIYSDMILFL